MADGSCLAKAGQTWVHAVVSRSVANKFHEKIKPTVHVRTCSIDNDITYESASQILCLCTLCCAAYDLSLVM